MRSREWANHKAYDRLPGRRLESSGENVSGEGAARRDVEDSEGQSSTVNCCSRRRESTAGREEKKGGLWRVN